MFTKPALFTRGDRKAHISTHTWDTSNGHLNRRQRNDGKERPARRKHTGTDRAATARAIRSRNPIFPFSINTPFCRNSPHRRNRPLVTHRPSSRRLQTTGYFGPPQAEESLRAERMSAALALALIRKAQARARMQTQRMSSHHAQKGAWPDLNGHVPSASRPI